MTKNDNKKSEATKLVAKEHYDQLADHIPASQLIKAIKTRQEGAEEHRLHLLGLIKQCSQEESQAAVEVALLKKTLAIIDDRLSFLKSSHQMTDTLRAQGVDEELIEQELAKNQSEDQIARNQKNRLRPGL